MKYLPNLPAPFAIYKNRIIQKYYLKHENNKLAKNKFEVFNSIPENDSEEWKLFINQGKKYSKKTGVLNKCPYCQQTLSNAAKELLQAYAVFLEDKSEEELQTSLDKLTEEYNKVKLITINTALDSDIEKLLEKHKIERITAKEFASNLLLNQKIRIDNLLSKIEKKDCSTEIAIALDEKQVVEIINNEILLLEKRIEKLEEAYENKEAKAKELETSRKKLLENKSIAEQINKFKKWFEKNDEEMALNKIVNSLTTKDISLLSSHAHEDLVTETLKENFKNELLQIGIKNIEITLVKDKSSKGSLNIKLLLSKSHKPQDILSEGEQKAVGLALFLAEVKSQNSHNPIILDDPVNSLDNKYSGNIAIRLMQIENQIIIFNHNLLFLNAFETSPFGHICKTIDSDCNKTKGKHIRIYWVQSEGKDNKGVLLQYNIQKANAFLNEATKLLSVSPFNEYQRTAVCLRRCVECCIDEVVFNNQIPTKYHTKTKRIDWDALAKMKTDLDIIKKLHSIHDRVSGGELHNGVEVEENPIDLDEFKDMKKILQEIINMKR